MWARGVWLVGDSLGLYLLLMFVGGCGCWGGWGEKKEGGVRVLVRGVKRARLEYIFALEGLREDRRREERREAGVSLSMPRMQMTALLLCNTACQFEAGAPFQYGEQLLGRGMSLLLEVAKFAYVWYGRCEWDII